MELALNQLHIKDGISVLTAGVASRFSQLILFFKRDNFFVHAVLTNSFVADFANLSRIFVNAAAIASPFDEFLLESEQKGSIQGMQYFNTSFCDFIPACDNSRTDLGERNEQAQSSFERSARINCSGGIKSGGI